MRIRSRLILCLLFQPAFVFGAEVLRVGSSQRIIAITHDSKRHWVMEDTICVFQAGQEIACGKVIKVTTKGAVVRLESKNTDVARGDTVKVASAGRRPAAALLDSVPKTEDGHPTRNNISGGVSAGSSFFLPLVHFQRAVQPKLAVGIMPLYFRTSTGADSVSALGVMGTADYYSNEYFHGLWIQVGAGVQFLTANVGGTVEKAAAPVLLTTVGWRGYWDFGLNVGVGAGIQYLKDPAFQTVEIKAASLQPLVVVDLGFSF